MQLSRESTGEELYNAWQASGLEEKQFWRRNLMNVMTYNMYHGKVYRYGLELRVKELEARVDELEAERKSDSVFGHDLGKPWRLDGDAIIAGDVHANTINLPIVQKLLAIAVKYLAHPRRFILAGDLMNADAFGGYENIFPLPSFGKELKAARAFLDMILTVFDEIWIVPGNHDFRVTKKTNNAIQFEDLMRMISNDPRIKVSHWGHMVIDTPKGEYRISHGSEYSVNQLVVAEQLALKHDQNVILWHEHHSAIGLDRFKRRIIVNGGGLFDADSMAYTQLEDNKKPRMANGFVLLRNGYPYVFNDFWTDWSFWLGDMAQADSEAA